MCCVVVFFFKQETANEVRISDWSSDVCSSDLRNEETDEDLQLIFATGSSLGGARPKASVIDQHGNLSIAKFPKETDEYSMEIWEEVALRLADQAGIATPHHELIEVAGKAEIGRAHV